MIEGLRRLEQGGRGNDATTYLVQIIDEPDQIAVFEASFALDILVPAKDVRELILKVG